MTRQILGKNLPQLLVIRFRLERSLLFPLLRVKIIPFPLQRPVAKHPVRGRRKHLDALEQGLVLEHATAGDELTQGPGIGGSELGTHGQNRFRLRRKIESFFRLVIIDPVHPVAVVEQRRGCLVAVDQQSVKPSIQTDRKRGSVLAEAILVEMNQVRRALRRETVPSLPETASGARRREFFSGKDQRNIALFADQRHPVGKRILAHCPAQVDAKALIHQSSGGVERFVPKAGYHLQQLGLRLGPRQPGDESDNSWHR